MEKAHIVDVEEGNASAPKVLLESTTEIFLSEEHRQYLLRRHGTLDISPIPSMNDADPFNWPMWKVSI